MNMLTEVQDPRARSWEHVLFKSADEISLSQALYDKINARYNTLQDVLRSADNPIFRDAHVFPQGSIRFRTAITPNGKSKELDTVDADAVVWLEHAGNVSAEDVLQAFEDRFTDGTRVQSPIEPLRRGIRIIYADENPGFHIDVTPARNILNSDEDCGHGRLVVPDRQAQAWKASAPIDYCSWLEGVAELVLPIAKDLAFSKAARAEDGISQEGLPSYADYADRNVLRAAIKLLKRNRDIWADTNADQCDYRPISAVITTLAGRAYEEIAKDPSRRFYRPIDALLAVVKAMPDYIKGERGNWMVLNPADREENFAEKWNRPGGEKCRKAFDDWHVQATKAFNLGLQDQASTEIFREEVNRAFGVGKTFVKYAMDELPANWNLPGRAAGVTRSSQLLEAFSGAAVASQKSQAGVQPVKRLG